MMLKVLCVYVKYTIETPKDGSLAYQALEFTALTVMKKVLPANCLCTADEEIPGLLHKHLPKGAQNLLALESKKHQNVLAGTAKLYIEGCTLKIPSILEIRVLEGLKTAYGESVEVTVGERRLNVGAHNQWCLVNSSKLKNSITLAAENDTLRCNGSLIVDSIYQAKGLALIFVLEYTLRLSRRDREDEYKQLALGELVYPILDVDSMCAKDSRAKIKLKMNTDPALSVVGNQVWAPTGSHRNNQWNIVLDCEVSATFTKRERPAPIKVNQETTISRDLSPKPPVFAEQKAVAEMTKPEKTVKELSNRPLLHATEAQTSLSKHNLTETKFERHMSPIMEKVSPQSQGISEADLQSDMQDPLKGNSIIFSFLYFVASGKPEVAVPENMCFSFKFFTFPTSYTQAVALRPTKNDKRNTEFWLQLHTEVKKWTNITSQDKDGKNLKLQFDFDPTLDTDTPQEIQTLDFLNYLAYNNMRIWVWDADGLTPIGSIRVNLFEILRRGAPATQAKRELDLVSEDNEVIGSICVQIENIGRQPGEIKRKDVQGTLTISKTPAKGKTKIYSKPMTFAEVGKLAEQASRVIPEEDQRKMDLVYNYRLHMSIAAGKRGIPFWLQEGIQNDVEKYRSLSRSVNMSNVLHKMEAENANYPSVYYSLGQMTLFPVLFMNSGKYDSTFHLVVDDPDHNVTVVTEPEEWKYFCLQEGYEPPSDWTTLQNLHCIPIRADDHLLVILKIFPMNHPKTGERIITVTMRDNATYENVLQKEISLKYKDTYYNAYYVFGAPEKRTVDVPLVTDLPNDAYRYAKAVKCNNSSVDCKLTESRLVANYLTPTAPSDTDLYFYLYSDEYCYRLLSIIYANVRAYTCMNLSGVAGKRMDMKVEFANTGFSTQVEMRVSNKQVIEVDERFAGIVEAPAGQKILIPVTISSFKPGKSRVLLHCIDYNTRDILGRWLFRLDLSMPTISYKYSIKAPIGEISQAAFSYQNETALEHTYEFSTSHPDIAYVAQNSVKLQPGDKASVPMVLKVMDRPKQAQILIFVEEKESRKCEALLFTISYVL